MGGPVAGKRRASIVLALPVLAVVGLAGAACSTSDDAEAAATSETAPAPTERTQPSASPTSSATTTPAAATIEATLEPGEILGRVDLEGEAERVVLAGDLAVVAAGDLVALNSDTLEPVWELDLGSNVRGVGPTGDRAAPIVATTDAGRVVVVGAAGQELDEFRHPDLPWDVAVGDGVAWVGGGTNRTLLRIDLGDGTTRLIRRTELPLRAVIVDDRIWVLGHELATVTAFDGEGDQIDRPIRLGEEPQLWPLTIDAGARYLWAGPSGDQLWRVDPASAQAARFTVPNADGRFLAVIDDRLWFVSTETGELIELDQETVEVVRRIPVEGRPIGLTGDRDRLFVTTLLAEGSALVSIAS